MDYQIGQAAGVVWQALDGKESLSVSQLKKVTGVDEKNLLLALGWLAREEKVNIAKVKSSYKVNLK